MVRPIVVVDPRFPQLLRDLRRQQGLSLRSLARLVNYSHTYLWEVEIGHKPPTLAMANRLDAALDAGGALAKLVVERTTTERLGDLSSSSDVLDAMGAVRHELEELARVAWSAHPKGATIGAAGRWAQLASWLYDAFVRSRPRLMRLGAYRYSRRMRVETGLSPFRIEVSRQGRVPRGECRSVALQSPPPDVASRLRIDRERSTVVRRENWYYADDEPVQSGVTYVPTTVAGDSCVATERALGRGGIYSRLEELGFPIVRIREEIFARLPTPDETTGLKIPPGTPVLEVLHTSYDGNNQPFEVTRFVVRGDLVGLDYEMPVEN